MNKESLEKSIDSLIEAMLLEKSEDVMDALIGKPVEDGDMNPQNPKAAKTTADAALPAEPPTEKEGRGGRPAEVHNVREEQGNDSEEDVGQGKKTEEARGYDAVQSEAMHVEPETTVAHNPGGDSMSKGVLISKEDYAFLLKAKEMVKARELKKSQEKQEALVKSMIARETDGLMRVNQALSKKLDEATNLLKSVAKQPRQSKSITNASVLEKSFVDSRTQDTNQEFSKSQKLDAAEALFKAGELSMNDVVELENTGFIYNPIKRAAVERKLLTGK